MGSSRASTPAGKRRTQKRAAAAKPAKRTRSAPHPKSAAKAAKPKTTAKPKRAASPPKKPKAVKRAGPKPKPSARGGLKQWFASNGQRLLVWILATLVLLAGVYFFWFRDSSFVRIEQVKVEGAEGPEADAIIAALTKSAKEMSTLNIDRGALEDSVSRFATVVALDFDADLPHGLTIDVTGRPPVYNAISGDRSVAVAADGTVLNGVDASGENIPNVEVPDIPGQGKVDGEALEIATVAGAAPEPLRPLIERMDVSDKEGVSVTLKGDIPIFFGDQSRAGEKWAAAAAILADPKVKTLTHVDVRVPERPSIGGAAPAPSVPSEP